MTLHRVAWPAALVMALVACSGNEPGKDEATEPDRANRLPSPSVASPSSSPAAPSPAATPPRTTRPEPQPSPPLSAPSSPGPADRRGDLVRGYRTLVGTIEAAQPCLVLRVGADRWALVGDRARGLASGARFEVRGTVTSPPRGCHTTRALAVSQVIRR